VNYWIGRWAGMKIFGRWINPVYLQRTHDFYERHGGKTIIIARFIPIIRTFAPFVAGVGTMTYSRFLVYNVVGGVVWVTLFVLAGYYFGNLPAVRQNFTYVILAIIVLSVMPIVLEFVKSRRRASA
jgi:membrane-associated protein